MRISADILAKPDDLEAKSVCQVQTPMRELNGAEDTTQLGDRHNICSMWQRSHMAWHNKSLGVENPTQGGTLNINGTFVRYPLKTEFKNPHSTQAEGQHEVGLAKSNHYVTL